MRSMGLVDLYYKLEEKWFAFVDAVSNKGIPLDKIVDPLERAGIPTFPLLITIILFSLYFSVLFFVPGEEISAVQYYKLTIKTMDENGNPLSDVLVIIGSKKNTTDENGTTVFELKEGEYSISVSKKGCENKTQNITLEENIVRTFILSCGGVIRPSSLEKTFIIKTGDGNILDSGFAYIYKKGKEIPETYPIKNGKVKIPLDENVEKIEFSASGGRCNGVLYHDEIFTSDNIISVPLTCETPSEERGFTITVLVTDTQGNYLEGVPVKIEDTNETQITVIKTTNKDGIAEFDNIKNGTKGYVVAGPYEEYAQKKKYIDTSTTREVQITLEKASKESFTYITVKDQNETPIEKALVTIYKDNQFVTKGYTNNTGVFKTPLTKNETYKVVVYKDGHYTSSEVRGGENKTITLNITKEIKFGSLTVYVYLQLNGGELKTPKNTYVYLKDSEGIRLPFEKQVMNGVIRFENVPVGNYTPVAVRNGVETLGEEVEIKEESVTTTKILLEPLEYQLIINVVKDSEPVPGARVKLYFGDNLLEETTTEIDGKAYFMVKEQMDYRVYAEKEIDNTKYIGEEEIPGYEVTKNLEKTVELMSPDYDIIYKGVSKYLDGPFNKKEPLDIQSKYYMVFAITPPKENEYVRITLEENNFTILAVQSDLKDYCTWDGERSTITIENCSGVKDVELIKYYIKPKELGATKTKLSAEFYMNNELMKKKLIPIQLNITTSCKVIDGKYICIELEGESIGVLTKPYNVSYELITNYEGKIEYKHLCSEESGSISPGKDIITVTPVKTGKCSIEFSANGTMIAVHEYTVSPVSCVVSISPDQTFVNGETEETIDEIRTDPEIKIDTVKVEKVEYPGDDYSGITKGDEYSEGDSFKLASGKNIGKVKILWKLKIPDSEESGICSSEISIDKSPLKIQTQIITIQTENLSIQNRGKRTIGITDVSLVYPWDGYEVSLNCYDEDLDDRLSTGENLTCTLTDAVLEKLAEYTKEKEENKKIYVFVRYEDIKNNKFTHKEQILFNVKTCDESLKVDVSPKEGTQGDPLKITLISAKYINTKCEEKDVSVSVDCSYCEPGSYKAGDTIIDISGENTKNVDKITITFQYEDFTNKTTIPLHPKNILQVELSPKVIEINKENLENPYEGNINAEVTVISITFNNEEVKAMLTDNGGTEAELKEYGKGDKIILKKLTKTDAFTLVWNYKDPKTGKVYTNYTTHSFKVQGDLRVDVSPETIDASKDSQEITVSAEFLGVNTPVKLVKCVPSGLCENINMVVDSGSKITTYPREARNYKSVRLVWRLEVPKGSNRVYEKTTVLNVINNSPICSEMNVRLEKTVITYENTKPKEVTVNISNYNGESVTCTNAYCTVENNKLYVQNIQWNSDSNTQSITVEFIKEINGETCIETQEITIEPLQQYLEELSNNITKVVNKSILNRITNLPIPKDIALLIKNSSLYNGEYFNLYSLSELIKRVLEAANISLDMQFTELNNSQKTEKLTQCKYNDPYINLNTFFDCKENNNNTIILSITLPNVVIGHDYITGSKIDNLFKNMSLERIVSSITWNEEGKDNLNITCGKYDVTIQILCGDQESRCGPPKVIFKKVGEDNCEPTVNNYPIFLGHVQIIDADNLCEQINGTLISKIFNDSKLYNYSCAQLENSTGKITGRDSDTYKNFIYVIPQKWITGSIPEDTADNKVKYRKYITETINTYKEKTESAGEEKILVIKFAKILDENSIGMFMVGNISLVGKLAEYYKAGKLNIDELKNESTLVIGRNLSQEQGTTQPPERPSNVEEWTPGYILFRALTDCGGANKSNSKTYTIKLVSGSDTFCEADCKLTESYYTLYKCKEKCKGNCEVEIDVMYYDYDCYEPICKEDWEGSLEFINHHRNSETYGGLNRFIYNNIYIVEKSFAAGTILAGDNCDPDFSNTKKHISPICSDGRDKPCDIKIVSKENIQLNNIYNITFKAEDPSWWPPYSPTVCNLTFEKVG